MDITSPFDLFMWAGRRRRVPAKLKILFACISGAVAAIPSAIRLEIEVATMLVIADSITGVWLAAHNRVIRSRTMRERFVAKTLQYMIICVMSGALSLLLQTWVVFGCGIGWITCIEFVSNLENLTRLETSGGIQLPAKLKRMLTNAGQLFAHVDEDYQTKRIEDEIRN